MTPEPGGRPLAMTCVGGGPAGLLFAILGRRAGHTMTVVEQQQPADSFGWGVTLGGGLLDQLHRADPDTGSLLREHAYAWQGQHVTVDGRPPVVVPSGGYAIRRRLLLEQLRARAEAVGVRIEARRVNGVEEVAADADLVIAADGANSALRAAQPAFGTRLTRLRNQYVWLGCDREFTAFTFAFVPTRAGWIWAYAYGFDAGASTFIAEMAPSTFAALGFDSLGPEAAAAALEGYFAALLDGARLHRPAGAPDRMPWQRFLRVRNQRWSVGNLVLLGDAAHTTHFSIGSGTRLAMEDAMGLAAALAAEFSVPAALAAYETTRQREVRSRARVALRSARWYENLPRYLGRSDAEFTQLMDNRHSPVMDVLPVETYLRLNRTADQLPAVSEPLRRLVSRL